MTRGAGIAVLVLLANVAAAQDRVYRCGADGREYSHQPCATGVAVDVADVRTPGQVREAVLVAARDARLAETLVQERRQRERATSRPGAAHIGPSRSASAPNAGGRPKAAPRKPDARHAKDDANLTPPLKAFAPPV